MNLSTSWRSGALAAAATALFGWMAATTGGCSSTTVSGDGGINCGAGSTECNGSCTAIARDPENCGACGKKCGAGEACSAGVCTAGTACQMGTSKCGSECVDTKTDDRNCGACGTKCTGNQVCNMGACAASCSMGQTQCGMSCVDGQTDRTNCGACGTVCKDGEVCAAGKCEISCQVGLTKCTVAMGDGGMGDASVDAATDGGDAGPQLGATYCANLKSDNTNCGTCGKTCASNEACVAGTCVKPCNKTALVLADGNAASNTAYQTNLTNAGFVVTMGATNTYAGSPAANTYGVVIVSPGTTYATDMPGAGQTALVAAATAGTGVVLTEWVANWRQSGQFATAAALVLFSRTNGITQAQTYTLTQPGHPIWDGLPASFNTPVLGGNTGNTLTNGGQQIASCTQCSSIGVAVRSIPGGRVVQIAHAAGYNLGGSTGNWYSDANTATMMTNAALWAARCK